MALHIKFLVSVALLNISLIHAQNLCPSSHCGGGSDLPVHYPFKFEDEASPSTNCTYFNLTCSEAESSVVVNLPSAGDFYVQKIDYAKRHIQLYDSGDCFISRILDLRLESSPFMADFENFTFYLCPFDADGDPIPCMSTDSTKKVIAVRKSFKYDHECQPIRSGMLPAEHDDTFFFLKWEPAYCVICKQSSWKSKLVTKLIGIALSLPSVTIMALSCCSVCLMKTISYKCAGAAEADPTAEAAPPPPLPAGGLDESKILGCMELVVVGVRNEGTVGAIVNSKTCSICLENYSEKKTVSKISRCEHCFHATCIRQWLGKNATCPVCRTSLSHDVV